MLGNAHKCQKHEFTVSDFQTFLWLWIFSRMVIAPWRYVNDKNSQYAYDSSSYRKIPKGYFGIIFLDVALHRLTQKY